MSEIKKDKFGPEYVIEVYDPKIGMEGFLVIDNTTLGLGKGGIRMTPNVTKEEVFRLARVMTWKNSLAGIPFGGAKAGIVWRGGNDELKQEFIRSFARMIKPFVPKKYIPGPDVNTTEKEMALIAEEIGDWKGATGKPSDYCYKNPKTGKKICGLPHELGSTGFGVAHATSVAAETAGFDIKKMFALDDYYNRDRQAYYKAIRQARKERNLTSWLEYFSRGLLLELQQVLEKVEHFNRELKTSKEPVYLSKRQREILDFAAMNGKIFRSDAVDIIAVSSKTAYRELEFLRLSGLLKRKGKGPSTHYMLS